MRFTNVCKSVQHVLLTLVIMLVTAVVASSSPYVVLLSQRSHLTLLPSGSTMVMSNALVQRKRVNSTQANAVAAAYDRLTRYAVADLTLQQVQELRKRQIIEDANPLALVTIDADDLTNDSLSTEQYALRVLGAKTAWQIATGKGIRVGVLDTGIDWNHPDLKHSLAINQSEDANGNGTFEPWRADQEFDGVYGDLDYLDNDQNGYIDDVIGYDFVDQTIHNLGDDQQPDPIPADEQGHGTSVAGVVAAQANNSIGIAGLAYNATITTLRAFDATGNAEEDDIAAALIYAAVNKIHVVNMSFGDGVDSPVLRDAITFAAASGCVLVASAGNTGQISRQFPAGYDDVIAVGSTNRKDQRSVFSSTGSIVDLVAPGEAIVTTAVAGTYRTVSGTSFSAPYVAATAAMLLERYPEHTPRQIAGILKETTRDLGTQGWDGEYGAGRLQTDLALTSASGSDVFITSPSNEQILHLPVGTMLPVAGSAYALLFDSYTVYVGRGIEPQSWTQIATRSTAVVNGLLADVPQEKLPDGDNVVRLVVNLKNGGTLESRRRVHIVTTDTLRVVSAELKTAWNADRRIGVLTVTSNWPTQVTLIRTPTGHQPDTIVNDLRYSQTHCIPFDTDVWSSTGTVLALLYTYSGDTASVVKQYDLDTVAMPRSGFTTFDNGQFAGYVLNDVRDMLNDGRQSFVMSDLQSGSFGPLTVVQRQGFDFVKTVKTADVWIPRGLGDANGNGKLETFVHTVGKAVLFEQQQPDGNPFSSVVFADTLNGNNAAAMADIDGDGLDDLVMISNTACTVFSWRNGGWQLLGSVANTSSPIPGNSDNRIDEVSVAIGDFDGDGAMEIAFADTDGDMTIAEYNGNGLSAVFTYESDGVGGSGYLASGDVNGDGKPEILFGVPDDPYPGSDREYGRQLWTYHLFTSSESGRYTPMWSDCVYGVRYGIGYRNGVELADVDGRAGAEILICAFQRMFVFTWDAAGGIVPLYYKPYVVTPRFLTHDFDADGIPELGYGTTTEEVGFMTDFVFSEYKSRGKKLPTPSGLQAVLLTPQTVRLRWMPVTGARAYRVYGTKDGQGIVKLLDSATATNYELDSLLPDKLYEFRISAIPGSAFDDESDRSELVSVATGIAGQLLEVLPATVTTEQIANGVQLVLRYSTSLPTSAPDPSHFVILQNQSNAAVVARSVSLAGDSALTVSFPPFTPSGPTALLVASSLFDRRGIPTETGKALLAIEHRPPVSELILSKLIVASNTELHLWFSAAVGNSVLNANSYTLTPRGAVDRVERLDTSAVILHLSASPPLMAIGTSYAVTVTDIESTTGVPITKGTGNTLGFVLTGDNPANVFVFPHPVSISSDGSVTFANLPVQATIEVVDQRFRRVQVLRETDGNGGAQWDLRDESGTLVPPGMYFYRVTGSASGDAEQSALHKMFIRQ